MLELCFEIKDNLYLIDTGIQKMFEINRVLGCEYNF